MKHSDTIFWLRLAALLTVAGVSVNLVIQGAAHLPWLLAGVALFVALLPWWPWIRRLAPDWVFGLLMFDSLLVMLGQFASDQPHTLMLLFFVLVPACTRLPRRYSVLCYTLFPVLALLPFLLGPDPRANWSLVVSVVPGFAAMIAFTEGLAKYRAALEANQKLLDELIEAQRREALPIAPSDPGLLTRRDREVLAHVAMGFSNKEIAEKLFLAEGTVKNRVSQLLEKIGARDRTQAALRARDLGLL